MKYKVSGFQLKPNARLGKEMLLTELGERFQPCNNNSDVSIDGVESENEKVIWDQELNSKNSGDCFKKEVPRYLKKRKSIQQTMLFNTGRMVKCKMQMPHLAEVIASRTKWQDTWKK